MPSFQHVRSDTRNRSPFLILAILLFFMPAGCGDDTEKAPTEIPAPPRAAGTVPREVLTLRVGLRNVETDEPLPSARVALLLQRTTDQLDVAVQETWTDSSGRAEFSFEPPFRAAVRSDFCMKPTEVDLAAEDAGPKEINLSARSSFNLSGRVIDASGKPVHGATVYVFRRQGGRGAARKAPPLPDGPGRIREFERRISPDPGLAGRTVTRADGGFEINVASPQAFEVAASCDGFSFAEWRYAPFDPVKGEHGPLDVIMRPAASLEVEFQNTKGAPVAGYRVKVAETPVSIRRRMYREAISVPFSAAALTDAAGVVRFSVPAGIALSVENALIFPSGAAAGDERDFLREPPIDAVSLSTGEVRKVTSTPFRKVRVACRVTDGEGRPIPQAELLFPGVKARTGADGTASLLVPYNEALGGRYRISKFGLAPVEGTMPRLEDRDSREIVLHVELGESRTVEVAADGETVSSVWLLSDLSRSRSGTVAEGEAVFPEELLQTSFRREGKRWLFADPELESKSYAVLVQTGRYSFRTFHGVPTGDGVIECKVDDPPPGAALEGRVVIPPGYRPQRVQVICMRNDLAEVRRLDPYGLRGHGMGWEVVEAGLDGTFHLEGLVPGRYAFAAVLMEWGLRTDSYAEMEVKPGESALSLQIVFPGEKSGFDLLVTDETGNPIPDMEVALLDPVDTPVVVSRAMAAHLVTDERGVVSVRDLVPGRYGFVVSGTELSGSPVPGRVLVKEGGTAKALVRLGQSR